MTENLDRVALFLMAWTKFTCLDVAVLFLNLSGDFLRCTRLIVTFQPSIPVLQLATKHPLNERLEVLGFTQEDVAQYVNKVLQQDDA